MEYPGRLIPVHRMAVLVAVAFALVAGLAAPAVATTETTAPAAPASGGPTLEATVGLGGFVALGRPATVTATISTPVLVAGRLRVRGGSISVSRPVEVPAGGEQAYQLTVPALAGGTRLTVEVMDSDDEVLLSEAVTTRAAFDELTVGLLGADDLAGPLARVRTVVTDRPVAPLVVPPDTPAANFDVLGYLVVGRAGADRLGDALTWAESGGSLVIEPTLAATADLPLAPVSTGLDGVTAARLGTGRVVVVDNLSNRDSDDWAAILRPTVLDLANSPQWNQMEMGGGLFQAASESGSRQVPSLPWLLFAILGFALVVGPVNFLVLSRLGKRDLAWITIPALSLLAVAGFWIAGRQRIAGTNLSHATVMVDDGVLEVRSVVVVAAGVSGERRVSFDDGATIYPEGNTFGSTAAELRIDGASSATLDLEQLGFTGVGMVTPVAGVDLPTVSIADGEVVVDNGSDLTFWGWGAMRGGSSIIGADTLGPGEQGRVSAPVQANQFGFGFIDSLINERQLWDQPERSNGLWALNTVLAAETDDSAVYFVGITDDYEPDVTVNGAGSNVPGPTLVITRAGYPTVGGATRAGATVVGTGFINWLDWGTQHVVATDELTVAFTLPDPTVTPRLRDSLQFGMPPNGYLAWDWPAGEFVDVTVDDPLPSEVVSPDGQVYVRLVGEEFGENPFSPDSLSLEWDA